MSAILQRLPGRQRLQSAPVRFRALKLACGRLPDISQDLCSQPTISRCENAQSLREIIRLNYKLVDIWCRVIRSRVVLDIDNTVDVVARHKSKSSAKGGR